MIVDKTLTSYAESQEDLRALVGRLNSNGWRISRIILQDLESQKYVVKAHYVGSKVFNFSNKDKIDGISEKSNVR